MAFQIKRVSNHGTSHPIVARLTVQADDLIQFCSLSSEKRTEAFSILHEEVQPKLLTCDDIAKALASEIDRVVRRIESQGFATQAQGRMFEVPQIIDLGRHVEQYLYSAKSALRDAAKLFGPFFGAKFTEARYDRIHEWCKQRFGPADELSCLIERDHDEWIHRLVRMRNAVEHPGDRSGNLHIHNFEVIRNEPAAAPSLIEPAWHLDVEPRSRIRLDLPVFVSNMLEFTEDLLVLSIRKSGFPSFMDVTEIPASNRDPRCPVRLRTALREASKSGNRE